MRGLEAYADGFDILPTPMAAEIGEVFIMATGSRDVLGVSHFERIAGRCDPDERWRGG